MTDTVDQKTRSRIMSAVKGKDTQFEMAIRKGLFAKGFRYRLHVKSLPGKPDIVLPRYKAVVLVSGCFWHGHHCCLSALPVTHREFWETKIRTNRANDNKVRRLLRTGGWRVLTIWQCAVKGPGRFPIGEVLDQAEDWIVGGLDEAEIRGRSVRLRKRSKVS